MTLKERVNLYITIAHTYAKFVGMPEDIQTANLIEDSIRGEISKIVGDRVLVIDPSDLEMVRVVDCEEHIDNHGARGAANIVQKWVKAVKDSAKAGRNSLTRNGKNTYFYNILGLCEAIEITMSGTEERLRDE